MNKLLRTGGFDPLEANYESPIDYDYAPLPSEALDAMLAFDEAAPMNAPHGVGVKFERGKIDFERVRREHLLEDVGPRLLEGYKQKSPVSATAACPIHGDAPEHGNLKLHFGPHLRSGSWICSSCRAHGDVLDLVSAVMGLKEPKEALNFLDGGRPLDDARRDELKRRAEENARRASAIPQLNLDLTEFARAAYNQLRGQDNAARRYLKARGLEAAIGRYGLGYVPRGFDEHLLPVSWDYEREMTVASLGFYERIMIPYRQPDGSVPVVNARRMTEVKPKYLKPSAGGKSGNSNARPYLLEVAVEKDGVIAITEGEFDAMSLGVAAGDLINEVAIPGVNCFTEEDAKSLSGRRVVLITDNDPAGRRAQGPLRELIEAYAETVTLLGVPQTGQDVNDVLIKGGAAGIRTWLETALKRRRRLW